MVMKGVTLPFPDNSPEIQSLVETSLFEEFFGEMGIPLTSDVDSSLDLEKGLAR